MSIYDDLWGKILSDLSVIFNEETYLELFEPLKKTYKYSNGYVYVIVDSLFVKSRIEKFYLSRINEIAEKHFKQTIRFKFITEEEIIEEETTTGPELDLDLKYRAGNLNSSYSFNNFVVGKSNRFAFSMAMKVADQPAIVANPLYIFGDVGLGKTHLMQAIGNYILDKNINQKVLYVKADGFIEDFTKLLSQQKMDDFHAKYREIDVLLVDDIQIMGDAKKTQMEFFKLFDYLYHNNKQIIITSDKPASELKNIMTRLTTRFEVGLSVDIQVPDLDHRIEILKRKLVTESADINYIPNEVLNYIATEFPTNIRELEGALKRSLFYCLTNDMDLTLDSIKEALEPLIKVKKRSNSLNENNYDKIQSVVSNYYQITIDDLIGKKRHSKYVVPRHIAMYLIKTMYQLPYKTIGQLFGDRDHSTVLSAVEKIENEVMTDKTLKLAIDTIKKKLN